MVSLNAPTPSLVDVEGLLHSQAVGMEQVYVIGLFCNFAVACRASACSLASS